MLERSVLFIHSFDRGERHALRIGGVDCRVVLAQTEGGFEILRDRADVQGFVAVAFHVPARDWHPRQFLEHRLGVHGFGILFLVAVRGTDPARATVEGATAAAT